MTQPITPPPCIRREWKLDGDVVLWRCSSCTSFLPASGFYAAKRRSGLMSSCRKCHTKQTNAHAASNLPRRQRLTREWTRKDRAANPEKYRAEVKRHRRDPKNRQKVLARKMLTTHVARGKIRKPETCSDCGASGRIEGHHPDYSKPLEVEWLCPPCHGRRHTRRKAA